MVPPLTYAAGGNFVQRKTGERLDRAQAQAVRDRHAAQASNPDVMTELRQNSAELAHQIDEAIAKTWPEQKEAAE
jgi:hypothetical protein